ncbi:uncharacterized protein K452DRAFT_164755 [Aplosporella prunicola CBS 121167]|uniref:Secreted protein n=1 Tax=Aplosporella prunicola CBS 121167 TaxID=1176127 RepID=A0A6A6AXT4_9PEZI|nr:uncharacterized protein K452DRAFT_164755 [Aplosporella prunicola CBS 121167]KAF2135774.1 hypothetical protein K452DRAFT_164755 [Aplosporella prunicola CBS 121167]
MMLAWLGLVHLGLVRLAGLVCYDTFLSSCVPACLPTCLPTFVPHWCGAVRCGAVLASCNEQTNKQTNRHKSKLKLKLITELGFYISILLHGGGVRGLGLHGERFGMACVDGMDGWACLALSHSDT